MTGSCSDEFTICKSNLACQGLYGCAEDCRLNCASSADPSCFDTCMNGQNGCNSQHPAGAADFAALTRCVETEECPTLCAPP
ncbi:uncharacterized protein CMC5_076310 [Chondromyces crocatus]|uniref:Uncharacterized protein n=1 Tax=Chondromyces crocatus TaxID=52 RepID=A0A0K1ERF0_CHOCO|nr:uncharacterized protein CMC5_076310 [Chondromyces crocatus]